MFDDDDHADPVEAHDAALAAASAKRSPDVACMACGHYPDNHWQEPGDDDSCVVDGCECAGFQSTMTPADELTPERIDELDRLAREAQERASKATAGPWEAAHCRVLTTGHVAAARQEDGRLTDVLIAYGSKEEREANASLAAAAREDVPVLSAAVLALSAEVRRMRSRLDRVTHERECLGTAIADAALKAGIYSGVPVTGPELILLAQAMANVIVGYRAATDERCGKPIGGMAVDNGEEEA